MTKTIHIEIEFRTEMNYEKSRSELCYKWDNGMCDSHEMHNFYWKGYCMVSDFISVMHIRKCNKIKPPRKVYIYTLWYSFACDWNYDQYIIDGIDQMHKRMYITNHQGWNFNGKHTHIFECAIYAKKGANSVQRNWISYTMLQMVATSIDTKGSFDSPVLHSSWKYLHFFSTSSIFNAHEFADAK